MNDFEFFFHSSSSFIFTQVQSVNSKWLRERLYGRLKVNFVCLKSKLRMNNITCVVSNITLLGSEVDLVVMSVGYGQLQINHYILTLATRPSNLIAPSILTEHAREEKLSHDENPHGILWNHCNTSETTTLLCKLTLMRVCWNNRMVLKSCLTASIAFGMCIVSHLNLSSAQLL